MTYLFYGNICNNSFRIKLSSTFSYLFRFTLLMFIVFNPFGDCYTDSAVITINKCQCSHLLSYINILEY